LAKLLVLEGLIGVGKTSLARILRDEWNARLVLEPADDNPFLERFYGDPERFAFPTQMFYMGTRFKQQLEMLQGDLFTSILVSDYLWEKDQMFAEKTLDPEELALYQRFVDLIAPSCPRPDLVVFLDASTEVVLERIQRRAISAERAVTAEYLDDLRERYLELIAAYDKAPVYTLRTDDLDYVNSSSDRDLVLQTLAHWLEGRSGEAPLGPAAVGREGSLPLFEMLRASPKSEAS
jgi:deoxyadenosine/deoxycytidine kinase